LETENSGSITEERAIGTRGFLIRGVTGEIWFRVYAPDKSFECEVVIIDPDAALVRNSAGDFLDYTTESMQIEK
jgi:hypothetical protein